MSEILKRPPTDHLQSLQPGHPSVTSENLEVHGKETNYRIYMGLFWDILCNLTPLVPKRSSQLWLNSSSIAGFQYKLKELMMHLGISIWILAVCSQMGLRGRVARGETVLGFIHKMIYSILDLQNSGCILKM